MGGPASGHAAYHVGACLTAVRSNSALHRDALQSAVRGRLRNLFATLCRPDSRRDTQFSAALCYHVPADECFRILHTARRQGFAGDQLFAGVETLVVTGAPRSRRGCAGISGSSRKLGASTESPGPVKTFLRWTVPAPRTSPGPNTCHAEVIGRETRRPVADGARLSRALSRHTLGSLYVRYDGGDVSVIDHSPCPCGLPSPRIKLLGRWNECFTIGSHQLLPYDIQFALGRMPELSRTTCKIARGNLAHGRLRLLIIEPRARRRVFSMERAPGCHAGSACPWR